MKKVTIYDIAKRVNTSPTTVSRALNGKGCLSEEMSAMIIKTAKEMNYLPDIAAKSLKTRRSFQIMLVVPDIEDVFYIKIIKAVQDYALLYNYSLLIQDTRSSNAKEIAVLKMFGKNFADGLILVSLNLTQEHLDAVSRINKPVVLCSSSNDNLGNITEYCDFVGMDSYLAVELALNHLIKEGHTDIGFVSFPTDAFPGYERLQAYVDVMKANKLQIREENMIYGSLDPDNGYHAGICFAKAKKRPTAVLCTTDYFTPGLYKALHESNIRIPQDIALATLDNIPMDQYLVPPITSVELFQSKMGDIAAKLLFESISGGTKMYSSTILSPELIVRRSSVNSL